MCVYIILFDETINLNQIVLFLTNINHDECDSNTIKFVFVFGDVVVMFLLFKLGIIDVY